LEQPIRSCDERQNVGPITLIDALEGAMPSTEIPRTKPQVCRGEGQTDYKRALAYRLLGIGAKDFPIIPYFSAELRKIARVSHVSCALALLAESNDPNAIKVHSAYLSVPESYRRLLPAEAYCHAAGVSPWVVLEAVTVAAVRSGAMSSAIVAAVNQPRVVQKTVEMALQDDGVKERVALFRAIGCW
jgi:hypothetical protein